ncbi:MAG TPA: DUF4921 family protein [Acidimicrobiales bacterium]|nr:DUF4921 family protein [Acidimicrobiales bacterium]
MSQLRLDPLTGRWVVITPARSERPSAFATRSLAVQADTSKPCPFCPGNEEKTPPALETLGPGGDWLVRVVPNRYPAFEGNAPMVVQHKGPVFTETPASGTHEVLVLSPDHSASWADLDDESVNMVMLAIKHRLQVHSETPGLRYSQVIVNSGREAGASIEHPHGQILGMPFVPRELLEEQAGFSRFAGNCLLCAAADAEADAGHRVVISGPEALVTCPYWSGMPYEMLVSPLSHNSHLHEASDSELASVGTAIRDGMRKLREHLGDVAYNIVFHVAPYRTIGCYHWHVHIWPKVTTLAGFELGTGVLINIVPPEFAAEELSRTESLRSATG